MCVLFVVALGLGGASRVSAQTPAGPLLLMGGYERLENRLVWDELVRSVGGPGKRVAVLAAAGSDPANYSRVMAAHLEKCGLAPVIVPSSVSYSSDFRKILDQPEWIAKVEAADAVFLLGGDQSRYQRFLLRADGSDSRMLEAIRAVNRRGGLIAGTSAGTAVMSSQMFVDGQLPYFMLQQGTRIDKELGQGFGFLPAEWFVDQHFLVRGRLARTLVAMQKKGYKYALGVDEDTALSVDSHGWARVVGQTGVLVIDASQAQQDDRLDRFNWRNLRLSYLSHGDRLNLKTRDIQVAAQKQVEHRPAARSDQGAASATPRLYYDVFNQGSMSKLMYELLLDSPHTTLGLCLNPQVSPQDPVQEGFQLRLEPTAQSVAWEGPFGPGDRVSVLHIQADITPVRIQLTVEEMGAVKP